MGRQINFEVHVSQKGRWEIHARHEDANAATEEAKTLDILPSVDEVKVVRDSYDPDTGDSVESIVYRSPKGKKEQAAYRLSEAKNIATRETTDRTAPNLISPCSASPENEKTRRVKARSKPLQQL